MFFSLAALKILVFILLFKSVILICLVVIFEIYPIWGSLFLEFVSWYLSPVLESSHLLSQQILICPIPIPFPCGTPVVHIACLFGILSEILTVLLFIYLFIYLVILFFLYFFSAWILSVDLFSSSVILSFTVFSLLLISDIIVLFLAFLFNIFVDQSLLGFPVFLYSYILSFQIKF